MSKKILVVTGIGDALCSPKSRKKIRDSEVFVDKIQSVVDTFLEKKDTNGIMSFGYPTETFKDVDVFKKVRLTQKVDMHLHTDNFLSKENELVLHAHDMEGIRMNGTEFTFIFRPEDYEVCLCGIDLHGVFKPTIEELLAKGYTVKLFSDAANLLPATRKYISTLPKSKKFQFCSYKSA